MRWLIGAAVVGGAVAAIGYSLHRLALWAESHGWIYYKTKAKFKGSSLGLIEGIYNASVEHVIEERSGEKARGSQDESGDKPDLGTVETPA